MKKSPRLLLGGAVLCACTHLYAAATDNAVEVVNKTSHPLYVFQQGKKATLPPQGRAQAAAYDRHAITLSTTHPKATIRFVTLSAKGKGCNANTCLLVTGD
ncbi:hypothetical protein [Pseudomonas nunensis]|uniref:Uncharacterized protein n=1 Tax=Pseudomonas nunensis TaxID=2961896 RepID=A0ABY5ECX9_9PSED|nr:hypothetical protein [Pseudomonas nunensis]KPN89287.1 hypothetical protein AL066_24635 [Pseudomonas nunensis]MCL5227704.1 hypothetical protein [Pseudomonas nunensis]UTO13621.1 hypothetical protein NK667_26165 [Pseudomonas nunensis]